MGAREPVAARFAPGARVRVRRADPPGHVRTPWYCRRPRRRDRAHLRQLPPIRRAGLQPRRLAGAAAVSGALSLPRTVAGLRGNAATWSRSKSFKHWLGARMNQQDEQDIRGYYRRMQSAIEELLILKACSPCDVEREVEAMDSRDPGRGAKMVARAWVDPAYKARAIANGSAAAEELGLPSGTAPDRPRGHRSSAQRHRLHPCVPAIRACCSGCRPHGTRAAITAAAWCASRARCAGIRHPHSRRGRDPRARLHCRHALHGAAAAPGRHRDLTEEQLAQLVTRDSLIGVALADAPAA